MAKKELFCKFSRDAIPSSAKLISDSNQYVWFDEKSGFWIKRARNAREKASIFLEALIYENLGVEFIYEDPWVLKTLDMGKTISWNEENLEKALDKLSEDYWPKKIQAGFLDDITQLIARVEAKFDYRLVMHPKMEELLKSKLVDLKDFSNFGKLGLCHSDCHDHNWLKDPTTGELSLIDWESAILAPLELDFAALIVDLCQSGNGFLVKNVFKRTENHELLKWCLSVKVITAASWGTWKYGEEAGLKRLAILEEAVDFLEA